MGQIHHTFATLVLLNREGSAGARAVHRLFPFLFQHRKILVGIMMTAFVLPRARVIHSTSIVGVMEGTSLERKPVSSDMSEKVRCANEKDASVTCAKSGSELFRVVS